MVVSPYNVQVNYLIEYLNNAVKVETVDKFQGQEAPIVLISMVTLLMKIYQEIWDFYS